VRGSEGRSSKLKVGLKYCGGCRSGYDRVEMVEASRQRLGTRVAFVAADSEDAEAILIVSGCSSACTKVDVAGDRPTRYTMSLEDAEKWIVEMQETLRRTKQ